MNGHAPNHDPAVNGTERTAGRILLVSYHLPWIATIEGHVPLTSKHSFSTSIPNGTANGSANGSANGTVHSQPTFKFTPRSGHSALFSCSKYLASEAPVVHIGYLGQCYTTSATANGNAPHSAVLGTNGNVLAREDVATAVNGAILGAPVPQSLLPQEIKDRLREELLREKRCWPVFLEEKQANGHYEGYCKTALWQLFHYILWDAATNGANEGTYWHDYLSVNQKFADAVAEVYQPGDTIWVQDYHLLLVPSMIREKIPRAAIGFFLHTPFPSSEIFRCLPKRKEILQGILGSNLVGFQTYSYARHFISSCTRVLGLESSPKGVDYQGHLVTVGIFPIGIDIQRVESRRKTKAVLDKMAAIRDMYPNRKIIIGRDKLDHIKGVQHKLNAFEKFLTLYPEWQNRVVLLQVTTPPQRESTKLESRVSELVSRINGHFGSLQFAPVHHYHQHLEQDEYYALLSVADLGLVTAIRDGMNTTSHEFVVCQQEHFGPLILSEFTGTAGSLSAAMLVNPWDYTGVANAINEALTMSREEKMIKHQQLYDHVISHSAEFWSKSFIKELITSSSTPEEQSPTPPLDFKDVVERYRKSKRRLLMFDYDGTLTPIRKIPSAAVPPPPMLAAMEELVKDPRNYCFVISGRDQECLENWLGHIKGLGLSAEHGSFIKYPDEALGSSAPTSSSDPSSTTDATGWVNLTSEMDLSWKQEVTEIFTYYTERTQGSFIEHKRCSITWHYRLADPDYGLFQAKECRNHLENAVLSKLPVEILIGKKNLE
ncbi:threalose-6-phosphate phosphatase, partial [Quaeritorhiza haematococci]